MTTDTLATLQSFHSDLLIVKKLIYDKCSFELTSPQLNAESAAYGACSFKLNGLSIQHRTSKITPTKAGQFVAVWKRNDAGTTAPYDTSDNIDFLVITAKSGDHLGQFIFPASILLDKGIMSKNKKGGKRGIRVYPPWDTATNKQAEKTRLWQTKYFLTINNHSIAIDLAKKMFDKKMFDNP